MRSLILALAALLAAACGGGGSRETMNPGPDAGTGSTTSIPLATWVHDLVANRSADDALPDTVEDKSIIDTDDPAAFDAYLAR